LDFAEGHPLLLPNKYLKPVSFIPPRQCPLPTLSIPFFNLPIPLDEDKKIADIVSPQKNPTPRNDGVCAAIKINQAIHDVKVEVPSTYKGELVQIVQVRQKG